MSSYRQALEGALDPDGVKLLDAYALEVEAGVRCSQEIANQRKMGNLLLDLHRCEHGRLQGDPCLGCGGPSKGNAILAPGVTIGHTVHGEPIAIPPCGGRNEPESWTRTP